MRAQVGQVINNKYRLLRLVGDGGMGSVYEARHEVLGTSVALKFLHPELSRRAGLVQRFLQEARVSAQVQSPHVVRVTDVDQAQTGAYIVMEFLEGRTLQTLYEELYRAGQQLSYADALEYAMQMLDGAEAAHKQGVVHRDLKPDNVMIATDSKGRALLKLLDFGIAKLKVSGEYERGLTRPGVVMGTPEYMAPEQAFSADAVDARADIFSLGVMIFEMLAGRRPVGGEDPQQIASAYLSGRIAQLTDLAPGLSPDLGVAVHRAMAALAKDRWQTVTELRDALEPFAIAAKAPSAMPRGSLSNPEISVPLATPVSMGPQAAPYPAPPPAAPALAPAAITPPATNVGGDSGAHAIPRTSSAEVNVASGRDVTNPGEPPAMSAPKLSDATPIGGFNIAEVEASVSGAARLVPPTKSVMPLGAEAPPADHGSTAFAAPLGEMGRPSMPSLDHSPRPSGTSVGEPFFAPPAAAYGAQAGPVVGFVPDHDGSASGHNPRRSFAGSDPMLGVAPQGPSAYAPVAAPPMSMVAAPARPKAKKRSFWSSIPAILLLAATVAGAVVGGVYVVQNHTKTEEPDDPPATSAPSATVRSDPPPEASPPPPPTNVPAIPGPKPSIQIQPRPNGPQPRPSSYPGPRPAPSTQPSSRPGLPIPIPIVIPSTFPLSFPFPQGGDSPPRQRPDSPPPRGRRATPDDQVQSYRPQRDPWERYDQYDGYDREPPRRRPRVRPSEPPFGRGHDAPTTGQRPWPSPRDPYDAY